jgi:predicted transcriptional regulator
MIFLSLEQIQMWLKMHQKRLQYGDGVLPLSTIANKAGISRQTLYAVLNGDRSEFGQVVQIRLGRVIQDITSDPDYQVSRMIRLELSGKSPRIRFGV